MSVLDYIGPVRFKELSIGRSYQRTPTSWTFLHKNTYLVYLRKLNQNTNPDALDWLAKEQPDELDQKILGYL